MYSSITFKGYFLAYYELPSYDGVFEKIEARRIEVKVTALTNNKYLRKVSKVTKIEENNGRSETSLHSSCTGVQNARRVHQNPSRCRRKPQKGRPCSRPALLPAPLRSAVQVVC